MILLYIIVFISAAIFLVSLSNLIFSPSIESRRSLVSKEKLVSLMVPCRNEEDNVKKIMKSLVMQSYNRKEIIFYDDNSTDRTMKRLREEKKKYPGVYIKLMKGVPLPDGWIGKNHACYQMARKARGRYLCFIDADVSLKKDAVKKVVGLHKDGLLSVFPSQVKKKFGEWLVVPNMKWFLLSFLPFFLIRASPRKEIVAANGQFMLFSSTSYKEIGTHKAVAKHIVEDMGLARLAKKKGILVETFISTKLISCRMYTSFLEGVRGFSKSFYPGTYMSRLGFSLFLTLMAVTFFVPFFYIGNITAIATISLLVANKIVVADIQKDYKEALFMPFHLFTFILLGAISVSARRRFWKGRKY